MQEWCAQVSELGGQDVFTRGSVWPGFLRIYTKMASVSGGNNPQDAAVSSRLQSML